MPGRERHIFISYRNMGDDLQVALKLYASLNNTGLKVWIDRVNGIIGGDNWIDKLSDALRASHAMVVVLSKNYLTSKVTGDEINFAYTQRLPIFPILIDDVNPYDPSVSFYISLIQYIDFRKWRNEDDYQAGFERLLSALSQKNIVAENSLDAETRYLTTLIATLEARRGVLEYVDLAAQVEDTSPNPLGFEAVRRDPEDPNEGFDSDFALLIPQQGSQSQLGQRITSGMEITQDTIHQIMQAETHANLLETENRSDIGRITLEINDAVDKYARFVLIGDPGAGKTTVLRHIALKAARARLNRPRTEPLPILLYLPTWTDEKDPLAFVQANWPFEPEGVAELLAQGDVILFLDGLNEMGATGREKAQQIRLWLNSDGDSKNNLLPAKVLITCRTADYTEDFRLGLPIVLIQEMNEARIRKFITSYLPETQAAAFSTRLFPSDDAASKDEAHKLSHLARNPYLLTALLFVFANSPDGDIPRNTGALFQQLARVLWERERHRQTHGWIPFEQMEAALGQLAFNMLEREMPIDVSYRWAITQVTDIHRLPDMFNEIVDGDSSEVSKKDERAAELLRAAHSANLLEIRDRRMRFYHQLIQEYFAAVGLQDVGFEGILPDSISFQPYSGRNACKLDQAVIALSGICPDPNQVLRDLMDGYGFVGDPWLAATCVLSGIHVSDSLIQRIIQQMVSFLNHEYPGIQAEAHKLLVAFGDRAVLPLLNALQDNDVTTRRHAAQILGEIRAPNAVLELAARLKQDDDVKVCENAACALGQIGNAQALPALFDSLSYPEISVRRAVITALGQIGDVQAVAILCPMILDEDRSVRLDVIGALAKLGSPECVPTLAKALFDDDTSVQEEAAKALGTIRNPSAIPDLLEVFDDPLSSLRDAAADALGAIGQPSLPGLIQWSADPDTTVQLSVIRALEQITDLESIQTLIGRFSRDNMDSEAAPKTAPRQSSPFSRPGAINPSRHWNLQRHYSESILSDRVILALAKIGIAAVLPLIAALEHADVRVRKGAADALGEIKHQDAFIPLSALLKDEDSDVRQVVLIALAKINDKGVTDQLVSALYDPVAGVRQVAANTLAAIADRAAVSGLRQKLRDSDTSVCASCAAALGQIGDVAAVDDLISVLAENSSTEVCHACIVALGNIADPRAIHVLSGWLQRDGARDIVIEALGKIKHASVVVILVDELTQLFITKQAVSSEKFGKSSFGTVSKQRRITELLIQHGSAAVPELSRLSNHPLNDLRIEVLQLLGQIRSSKAIPAIVQRLHDADSQVRLSAIKALQQINDPAALTDLMGILDDPVEAVRQAIVATFSAIDGPGAVQGLVQALDDADPKVREDAAKALGDLGDNLVIDSLIRLLADENTKVIEAAITALEKLGDPLVIPELIGLLQHAQWDVRAKAARALRRIGWQPATTDDHVDFYGALGEWSRLAQFGPSAVPTLLQAQQSNSSTIRKQVVEALGQMGKIQEVVAALSDPDSSVRGAAVKIIKETRWFVRDDLLLTLLKSNDVNARQLAAGLCGTRKIRSAIIPLLELLHDQAPEVRVAAIKALAELGSQHLSIGTFQRGRMPNLNNTKPFVPSDDSNDFSTESNSRANRLPPEFFRRASPTRQPGENTGLEMDNTGSVQNPITKGLLEMLDRSQPNAVIAAVIEALGQLKDPVAVRPLAAWLTGLDARVIEEQNDQPPTPVLPQMVADMANSQSILDALKSIGSAAQRILIRLLAFDLPPTIFTGILHTLSMLVNKDMDPSVVEQIVTAILSYLKADDDEVREAAAMALQLPRPPGIPPSLEQRVSTEMFALLNDSSQAVRIAAMTTLSCLSIHPVDAPVGKLVEMLHDANIETRQAAGQAVLMVVPSEEISVELGTNIAIARQQWADVKIYGLDAVPFLVGWLDDANDDFVHGVLQTLSDIGGVNVVSILVEYMLKQAYRASADNTFGSDVTPTKIEADIIVWELRKVAELATLKLLNKIGIGSKRQRLVVVQALWSLGEATAIPGLIYALQDDDSTVRRTAAQALRALRWRADTPELKALYAIARQKWGLCGQLGAVCIPYLVARLADADPEIARNAARTLDTIGWQPATPDEHGAYLVASEQWDDCVTLGNAAIPYLIARIQIVGYTDDSSEPALFGESRRLALISEIGEPPDHSMNFAVDAMLTLGRLGDLAFPALSALLNASNEALRHVGMYLMTSVGSASACRILRNNLSSEHPDVRLDAVKAAGTLCMTEAVPNLLAALKDPNPDVRQAVIEVLAGMGNAAVIPDMMSLQNDPVRSVRCALMEAIVKLDSEATLLGLFQMLNDADGVVREAVAEYLTKRGRSVLPAVIEALDSNDARVHETIAHILGSLQEPEVLPILVKLLDSDDTYVRIAALEALASTGQSAVLALPSLDGIYQDPNIQIRRCVVLVVEAIGRPAIQLLIRILDDMDPNILMDAIKTARTIGDPAAVPALIRCLDHDNSQIRSVSAEVLGTLGSHDATAASALLDVLKRTSEHPDEKVVGALGQLRDSRAVPILIDILHRVDFTITQQSRFGSRPASGLFGSKSAVGSKPGEPSNAKPSFGSSRQKYEQMITVLGQIGDSAAAPLLIELLDNPVDQVREFAVEALGKIDSQTFLSQIVKMLKDTSEPVRKAAIMALPVQNDTVSFTHLLPLLSDSSSTVRHTVVARLENASEDIAFLGLSQALGDSDETVRRASVVALGRINTLAAIGKLMGMLNDKSSAIRRASIAILRDQKKADIPGLDARLAQVEAELPESDSSTPTRASRPLGRLPFGSSPSPQEASLPKSTILGRHSKLIKNAIIVALCERNEIALAELEATLGIATCRAVQLIDLLIEQGILSPASNADGVYAVAADKLEFFEP